MKLKERKTNVLRSFLCPICYIKKSGILCENFQVFIFGGLRYNRYCNK